MSDTKIALFRGNKIRKAIHNNEWWFVINDIIKTLTDYHDPAQYFKRLKQRDDELAKLVDKGGYNLYHPLCLKFKPTVENKRCIVGTRKAYFV